MKFMLFVCADPTAERTEPAVDIEEWLTAVKDVRIDGDRLEAPADARTVRVRGGERLVTEGPFAETQEWIAGYDVLECDSLDEAIGYAALHPMAVNGLIEVRPFPAGD